VGSSRGGGVGDRTGARGASQHDPGEIVSTTRPALPRVQNPWEPRPGVEGQSRFASGRRRETKPGVSARCAGGAAQPQPAAVPALWSHQAMPIEIQHQRRPARHSGGSPS